MRLSRLQKYILAKCYYDKKGIAGRREFYDFYSKEELNNRRKSVEIAVHNSIERLVEKDLLTAYGHKTAKRWFIHKAKITNSGKKVIRELIKGGRQKPLVK